MMPKRRQKVIAKKAERKKVTAEEQRDEITKICEKDFIKKGEASYRTDNLELAYIENGECIKGDCKYRRKKIKTKKILLPPHLRKYFLTRARDGTCFLPEDKIGQVVICLDHFFFVYQKQYLKTGKLPEDSRLIGCREHKKVFQEGDEIPPPPSPEKSGEGDQVTYGCRISMTIGLVNTDWAKTLDLSPPQLRQATTSPTTESVANSPDLCHSRSPTPSSSRGNKRIRRDDSSPQPTRIRIRR
jgi:hypothetical protein